MSVSQGRGGRAVTVWGGVLAMALMAGVAGAEAGQLHDAARHGDVAAVRSLLEDGAWIDERDGVVGTPLHWAAARGHHEVLTVLAEAGATLERPSGPPNDYTALHVAAAAGHVEAVRALIDAGAEVGARASAGETPLHLSAGRNHAEVVALLVASGADVDAITTRRDVSTPLHWAAESGRADALQILLEAGARVDIAAPNGTTALHAAVYAINVDGAEHLIAAGADVRAVSTHYGPVLGLAGSIADMQRLFASLGLL